MYRGNFASVKDLNVMLRSNCGKENKDNHVYSTKCGNPVTENKETVKQIGADSGGSVLSTIAIIICVIQFIIVGGACFACASMFV